MNLLPFQIEPTLTKDNWLRWHKGDYFKRKGFSSVGNTFNTACLYICIWVYENLQFVQTAFYTGYIIQSTFHNVLLSLDNLLSHV